MAAAVDFLSPDVLDELYDTLARRGVCARDPARRKTLDALTAGSSSSHRTYRLTADGYPPVVISIFRHQFIHRLMEPRPVHQWAELHARLRRDGLPVPAMIVDHEYLSYGNLLVGVTEYVTGRHFEYLSEAQLTELGRMLARLHTCSERYPPILVPGKDRWAMLLARRELFANAHVRKGWVHGDISYSNLLFCPAGERIVGFIDFELARYTALTYDIAMALQRLCYDSTQGAYTDERIYALLRAYHAQRPLEEQEVSECLQTAARILQRILARRSCRGKAREGLAQRAQALTQYMQQGSVSL